MPLTAMVRSPTERRAGRQRYIPLFWRLFVPNAAVLGAACVVLVVEPANGRVAAIAGGFLTLTAANLVLMRRAIEPLTRLTSLMRRVDPLRPGERLEVPSPQSEVSVLGDSFDEMLDRLERERRDSARRALVAQEVERRRLAGELHDGVGQTLAALVLQLSRIADRGGGGVRADAIEARDVVLGLVDDIRALARGLRPEALDALGLVAALTSLAERLSAQTGLPIDRDLRRSLPALTPEADLVVFRVAQESLANVVRHARASRASLSLRAEGDTVVLTVCDDGVGFAADHAHQSGIRGIRERALLIGAEVDIGPRTDGPGTQVVLRVGPAERREGPGWDEGPRANRRAAVDDGRG